MICELPVADGVATLARSRGSHLISIYTDRAPAFYDITDEVMDAVADSGIRDGMALVYSRHTTAAIKINEHEPLLIEDMEDFLTRIASPDEYYQHNDFDVRTTNMTPDEQPNGHAHCQHLLLSASETIPVTGGRLDLGTWQRIFLVELDRPRPREVLIKVIGA
jgi:secondary thiamine-phosphate synthase enzyme